MKSDIKVIIGLAVFKFAIHMYVNIFAGYEIFRDELYYLACASNPSFGYVDQPPFSSLILGLFTSIFGDSLLMIRTFPAIIGGLTVYLIGKICKELGGSTFAIIIACLAFIISPINLGFTSYYSMNVIDIFFWSLTYYLVVKLIKTEDPKIWIYIGLVLGFALLNKISVLWLGVGLLTGLLLTSNRKWLKTKWPYLAGIIALVIFSPFLIWNGLNDWAHIEFISNASSSKYSGLTTWTFLSGQFLINHPTNFVIWVGGLVYLFTSENLKRYRLLGWIVLTTIIILSLNGRSKSEYLAAALPILFVSGGIMLESWKWLSEKVYLKWIIVVIFLSGLVIAPLAIPVLSEESHISYSRTLGLTTENNEGNEESELPQFFADMHGWESHAKAIAEAYHSLSQQDKENAALFGSNYGRSGAIDYYSDELDMPKSIGSHNSYWLWGSRDFEGEILILMSTDPQRLENIFESVELFSEYSCNYCMPYENNQRVYIARGLKIPVDEWWRDIKNYNKLISEP